MVRPRISARRLARGDRFIAQGIVRALVLPAKAGPLYDTYCIV